MLEVRPVDAMDEVLLVGTCKEFLPESEGCAGGALGVAETPEAAGHLLAGGGGQKVVGLVSPEDGAWRVCGADLALALLFMPLQFLFCKHNKLKQLVDSVKFFIINNVLNLVPQTRIETTNGIFVPLHSSTSH